MYHQIFHIAQLITQILIFTSPTSTIMRPTVFFFNLMRLLSLYWFKGFKILRFSIYCWNAFFAITMQCQKKKPHQLLIYIFYDANLVHNSQIITMALFANLVNNLHVSVKSIKTKILGFIGIPENLSGFLCILGETRLKLILCDWISWSWQ